MIQSVQTTTTTREVEEKEERGTRPRDRVGQKRYTILAISEGRETLASLRRNVRDYLNVGENGATYQETCCPAME